MSSTLAPIGIDRRTFAQCFNRLVKAKRANNIDAADVEIYYRVLSRFPPWAIEAAADALMSQATFGFPTTDVWVTTCDAAVQRRLRDTIGGERAWQDECATCRDTGWREHDCTAENRCGRSFCARQPSYTHKYVSACLCRPHNATYRRQTLASQRGSGK